MKKIVSFEMRASDYSGICHHILSEAKVTGCSMVSGSIAMIQIDEQDLLTVLRSSPLEPENISDVSVPNEDIVSCFSVFSSSGKAGDRGGILSSKEALVRFYSLTGLGPASELSYSDYGAVKISPLPMEKFTKFNVVNRFQVSGNFVVKDRIKFQQAVLSGIGTRRSWGHGLMLVEGI